MTSTTGFNSSKLTNQASDNDEKQRKRREQLAAWRQKKQQALLDKKQAVSKVETEPEDEDGEKKRLRQQRIEEWKRARLQKEKEKESTILESQPRLRTSITLLKKPSSFGKGKTNLQRKRVILADNEEETEVLKKKIPRFSNGSFEKSSNGKIETLDNDDNNADELDNFMGLLNNEEKGQHSRGIDNDMIADEDEDEGEDVYEKEVLDNEDEIDKILSTKLTKLRNVGKELKEIDHASIDYPSFSKNFYQEPFEIRNMSQQEIDMVRLELDNIKVRGKHIPAPFTKWSQLLVPENLSSTVNEDFGFVKPSPIQSQAIPIILSGRDMIGVAKTGSGKTLAYVIPMLRHVQDRQILNSGDGPTALVLSPTRELALQIEQEVTRFKRNLNFKVCCCYGGANIESQITELKRGVDVIVATPGRLIDLLVANSGRVTSLRGTTFVVLDEADRMFDMGFEPQIQKIFSQIRPDKQTVLFSATFPRKLETLAKRWLQDPIEVIVGGVGVVATEITQNVVMLEGPNEKMAKLQELLTEHSDEKVLVFVEKQIDADKLVSSLLRMGFPCLAIHGGKDQIDRQHAVKEFADESSGVSILVATSIAARGLDVKNLSLVVNFDPPSHLEDYVHRVGRTGRAGARGEAFTFVTKSQEKEISIIVKALKMSSIKVETELQSIADSFGKKLETGEEKRSFGFGGKGLDKLQSIRDTKIQMQKKMYGTFDRDETEKNNETESGTATAAATAATAAAVAATVMPSFEVIEGNSPETSGPDKCKFYSRITINDLPQKVRWKIVQRESLSKIIDTTKTSITTRGQYYSPSCKQLPTSDKPKLYLLVEGLTRQAVEDAIAIIREKMIQGIQNMSLEDQTGRYVV
ncbi:PRP5 [Candida oxycetoniae]|uniref:RNA helicase n=1 Tax=Candida oxycetoniae TaxID=497107 RepID=A0AAI9SUN1_9ASCO|nr:PRP5 [Candida oxycetoniae]KAI3402834.2 PRP5 [Candida oxycetoniae]